MKATCRLCGPVDIAGPVEGMVDRHVASETHQLRAELQRLRDEQSAAPAGTIAYQSEVPLPERRPSQPAEVSGDFDVAW